MTILILANIAVTITAAHLLWRKLGQVLERMAETDAAVNDVWDLVTQNPALDVDGESAPQLMRRLYGSK